MNQASWTKLNEAVRMSRVPGILFVDSRRGRRPVLAGTGLDVWEVIASWKATGRSESRLGEVYDWLSEFQLRAALNYYALYPEEIDARLAVEESWTPERLRRELPFSRLGSTLSGALEQPGKQEGHGREQSDA